MRTRESLSVTNTGFVRTGRNFNAPLYRNIEVNEENS